jgi:uncharacterized protein YecE (DUF72 family)
MAEILIGTCGFSYNEWIGPVYPEGTKKDQFLPLYAGRFKTVELDYTYYMMPKAKNIAYFRLYGRNKETWWGSDSTARYDYLYSDGELEAAAERIKQIIVKANRLVVYFNNHARGQAVKNAQMLKNILEKMGIIKPGEGRGVSNGGQVT